MSDYYDRAGRPCDLMTWARALEAQRRVALDTVTAPDGTTAEVSTVWLGLDHRWGGKGPPLIFESMVFGGPDAVEGEMDRYSTEAEALAGHAVLLARVRAAMGVEGPSAKRPTRVIDLDAD